MRKAIISFILILIIATCRLTAHSGKPQYRVIIDTDCAIDDFRAITLLLASSEVEVLGITTSDGTLNPGDGLKKIELLLRDFHHEGIPTASGDIMLKRIPEWRDINNKIYWSKGELAEKTGNNLYAADFIIETTESETKPVTLICLGSLTNIVKAIRKDPSIRKHIQRIVWFNRTPDITEGTNYNFDKKSADFILNSGIKVDIVSNPVQDIFKLNSILMDSISNINSIYARKIFHVHQQKELRNQLHKGFLNLWDDLVSLYLVSPEMFNINNTPGYDSVRTVIPADTSRIKQEYTEVLDIDRNIESKMFRSFPVDPGLYREDVAGVMNEIIHKHGLEEWKLGILANELHGHLGIYAIVGVKMGLRAREFYNIGVDDIKIFTYAGRTPPLSCMNDGLQVSTGGTLGHGLIFLADDSENLPAALFSYKDRTIIIKLKDKYLNIVRNDIRRCISEHGNLTEDYWKCVRRLAIDYWSQWDRNIIFDLDY
ncbi:MAG: nucleoside hydrolase [Bacteroidales bacterium]|nr:MAG: nucleoside hydrolase [Bacteroidales bacterium]